MYFIVEGHSFVYDVQTIIQVFYPNEKYAIVTEIGEGITVLSRIQAENCYAAVFESGKKVVEKSLEIYDNNVKALKRLIKLTICDCLSRLTGMRPSWGIITGIRPAKSVHSLWREGISDEQIKARLVDRFLALPKKAALAIEIAKAEANVFRTSPKNSISFYAGIPFCPTTCLYCSFASYPIEKNRAKVDSYIDALMKELLFCKQYAEGRYLESFYIGGGTPTSLNSLQLERLLYFINDNFDIQNIKEFTVEAGRPDTITKEKLAILKKYGATRISVNPQTMNDKTLQLIGRRHSVLEFVNAYELARSEGFDNINIDVILGLPDETVDDVKYTMERISRLNPNAITVHTLAIKRASELKQSLAFQNIAKLSVMEEMLLEASEACRNMGLLPYYMYRQKNSEGNFENVGYAKPGYECVYNVQIMCERQNIIATGAGASTKIVTHIDGEDEFRIERVFNVKNVDEYINRIDEMLDRKRKGVLL